MIYELRRQRLTVGVIEHIAIPADGALLGVIAERGEEHQPDTAYAIFCGTREVKGFGVKRVLLVYAGAAMFHAPAGPLRPLGVVNLFNVPYIALELPEDATE